MNTVENQTPVVRLSSVCVMSVHLSLTLCDVRLLLNQELVLSISALFTRQRQNYRMKEGVIWREGNS